MKILSIETSCDETGISLLEMNQSDEGMRVEVQANRLASQASDHEEYGGVFPTLAKRLHGQNFPPLFTSLCQAVPTTASKANQTKKKQIQEWTKRHDGLADHLINQAEKGLPNTDYIAVTVGPGLTPALWVGINIARSLALLSETPLVQVNHMAGHVDSARVPDGHSKRFTLQQPTQPGIALLVSGGHTELIKETANGRKKIGQTRDDAAGEAFDKIGRLLGLPYPAGPHVSKLAEEFRGAHQDPEAESKKFDLPRPMINSNDLDFSFAGLKTAAAGLVEKHKPLSDKEKQCFAYELESAIVAVLIKKTRDAIKKYDAQSLLVGGGVTANQHLRKQLRNTTKSLGIKLFLSPMDLATDNAIMIDLAAGRSLLSNTTKPVSVNKLETITANSRLSL